jgi:hypothetical protein
MLCAWGGSISFHHCAGEFKYLSLNDDGHEKKCCKGKKAMADGCCKSLKVTYKKTDHKAQTYYSVAPKNIQLDEAVAYPYAPIALLSRAIPASSNTVLWRPPPKRKAQRPLYIRHSVFLI